MGVIRYILKAIEDLGYERDKVISEAILLYLSVNKELREKVAIKLYREGVISLGKACEIAGLSYEEMKRRLIEEGVQIRRGPESVEELKRKAEHLKKLL